MTGSDNSQHVSAGRQKTAVLSTPLRFSRDDSLFLICGGAAFALAMMCGVLIAFCSCARMHAQVAGPVAANAVLDRVVADVDGQAILASDVDDEMRFTALQPAFEPAADNTPQRALERVIDRTLIDQQRALQPGVATVSQRQVDAAIAEMRKQISSTGKVNCETDAGWRRFLAQHGFTPTQVQDRMRERLAILKFIDARFGVVVQVSNADVSQYYEQVLLPQLKKQNVAVPKLNAVAPRIREILRQRQVSGMIDDWLKSLRAEGHVRILDPAYAENRTHSGAENGAGAGSESVGSGGSGQ